MIAGITSGVFDFNAVPKYQEFLNNFETPFTSERYSQLISKIPLGTIFKISGIPEYEFIKNLVKTIILKPVVDTTQQEVKEINANDEKLNSITKPAENLVKDIAGGGEYKIDTLLKGSNQVVYKPNFSVSPFSAHLGYMAVSFGGALANAIMSRPEKTYFISNQNNMNISYKPITIEIPSDESEKLIKAGRSRKKHIKRRNTRKLINFFK